MARRAAGRDRPTLGLPRLHDARPDVPLGPTRADRHCAGAPRGDPGPDAIDPAAELRDRAGLDRRTRAALLPRPARRRRDLLSAVRARHQLVGPGRTTPRGEVDPD